MQLLLLESFGILRQIYRRKKREAMKKYELTSEYVEFDGRKLYRIKALKSFYLCGLTVKAGALGGYIEKEENLSQEGNAWIHGNLEGFREWAKKTFDGKNQKEYLTIEDFMEQHFAPEKEED